MHFSATEQEQYARHFILPGMGLEGQQRLRQARVLVIGAGGLGAPLLQYLAAAGVGHIGIVDADVVSRSNLQRQVLYGASHIGQRKVEVAKNRLLDTNPHISIATYPFYLNRDNALDLISQYDVVADGTDNFPTRYLVNDACILAGKTNIYASILRYEGQVSVFNALLPNGSRGPNYRDLYPTPPSPGQVPNCAEAGVLGSLAGIVGSMQANETIKLLAGIGEPLIGKLWLFDAATMQQHTIRLPQGRAPKIDGLIDYEDFCGFTAPAITVQTLHEWLNSGTPINVLDVRNADEREQGYLPGYWIPLPALEAQWPSLPLDLPIVVYCQKGQRSDKAVRLLLQKGLTNVNSLNGGWEAWNQYTIG